MERTQGDESFYGQCVYHLSAFDQSDEVGVEDGGQNLDLGQTVGRILEKLEKVIVNLTCPVAVYFWILVDRLITFCQRVANACLAFTDFGCYVLTHVTCRASESDFLRDSQKAEVQALLDKQFNKLALDLTTLTGNERL